MTLNLKVGDRVRAAGREEVGTVARLDIDGAGTVRVEYEARPGTITLGFYPASDLAVLPPLEDPVPSIEPPNPPPPGTVLPTATKEEIQEARAATRAMGPADLSKKTAKSGGGAATASPPPVS
jgi:hypothetical protein